MVIQIYKNQDNTFRHLVVRILFGLLYFELYDSNQTSFAGIDFIGKIFGVSIYTESRGGFHLNFAIRIWKFEPTLRLTFWSFNGKKMH